MKNRLSLFILALFAMFFTFSGCGDSEKDPMSALRNELNGLVSKYDATVGVGVITANGDTMTVNNNVHYPMMSVFKFHQAVAVSDYMARNNIPLDTEVLVLPEDLNRDTWSPLRDEYPEGNVKKTIAELFSYTLQLSDNLACDILFDRFVSPLQVEAYTKNNGVDSISIKHTEADMFANHILSYENWTTPYDAAVFVDKFIDGDLIADPYFSLIKEQMIGCTTGTERLVKPFLQTDYMVGHKTGSGYVNDEGRIVATNDIGFVLSPDGKKEYVIAVFVKDSALQPVATENIIAEISAVVKKYLLE